MTQTPVTITLLPGAFDDVPLLELIKFLRKHNLKLMQAPGELMIVKDTKRKKED